MVTERHEKSVLMEQLGVFYAAQKLASMGWIVHSTSFGSAIDLIVEKRGELRKIQVKCAMKQYLHGYGTFWHYYPNGNFYELYHGIIDYLILVCVDKKDRELVIKKVVIFPKEDIPNTKGIRIFEKHLERESRKQSRYVRLEDNWNLIK